MTSFWAVYFGATLALVSIFIFEEVWKEYRRKQLVNRMELLFEELEDYEADDEDDDECCK
jgi:hypothetical protein